MSIKILPDAEAVADFVAERMLDALAVTPTTIGVATGSTFEPVYRRVVSSRRPDAESLRDLTIVLIDEYVGLAADDHHRYRNEVLRGLANPLGVSTNRVIAPPADDERIDEACRTFERNLHALGGVDFQLLGLGRNGHIGFNEPGARGDSRTRLVELTEETRRANSRFFGSLDSTPTHAVTQGIATLLDARRILLVATGAAKQAPVAALLQGAPDAAVPATWLLDHPDVLVVLDHAAAGRPG